jgi:hypothetical protein
MYEGSFMAEILGVAKRELCIGISLKGGITSSTFTAAGGWQSGSDITERTEPHGKREESNGNKAVIIR